MKQVGDIPRQYRRTNRAEPTEPSQYVATLIQPCEKYYEHTKDESKWMGTIFEAITKDYQRAISEVLEGNLHFFTYFLNNQTGRNEIE